MTQHHAGPSKVSVEVLCDRRQLFMEPRSRGWSSKGVMATSPLSWKKTHLAEVNTWLGFVVHPNIPQVLMAANKHILVMEVLQIMVEGQAMHLGPHPMGNGRMSAGKIDASMEDGHHHGGETP